MTETEDSLWGLIDLGLYFSKMFVNFVALTSEHELPNLQGRLECLVYRAVVGSK